MPEGMKVSLVRARQVELGLAVGSEKTPVGLILLLAVVTNALGLPGFVESLKVENVDAPGQHSADSVLPVPFSILSASLGVSIVRTAIGGPTSLAVSEDNLVLVVASNPLNMLLSKPRVIPVGLGGMVDIRSLPIGEAIGQAMRRLVRAVNLKRHRFQTTYK